MESLNINYQDCYTYTGNTLLSMGRYFMQDNQSQTHWIYAAAIMDSDGCFMVTRYKRVNNYAYMPNVKISMINNGSINYILQETGLGYINVSGTRPSRPNSLPLYEWRITNKADLMTFLNGIMPYMKNKKDRALHLLDFCKHEVVKKGFRLSKDELDWREESYLKMRELNANKVGATTKPQGPEKVCDSLI